MKNRSLNKFQLLMVLMLLLGISIGMSYAASPANSNYQQWKSEQQNQDRQLKTQDQQRPAASALQNHYLSKPVLSQSTSTLSSSENSKSASSASANSLKIRLNSASAEQFQQLNGIGQKKAEAIVDYRSKNGKFKSIEQIQEVKGIGPAIFAKNKERLAL